MAVSIWTPVEESCQKVASSWQTSRLFTDKWREVDLGTGTHILIQIEGTYPAFYSLTTPTTEADLRSGTPIFPGQPSLIFARTQETIYLSFPEGDSVAWVSLGTAT